MRSFSSSRSSSFVRDRDGTGRSQWRRRRPFTVPGLDGGSVHIDTRAWGARQRCHRIVRPRAERQPYAGAGNSEEASMPLPEPPVPMSRRGLLRAATLAGGALAGGGLGLTLGATPAFAAVL